MDIQHKEEHSRPSLWASSTSRSVISTPWPGRPCQSWGMDRAALGTEAPGAGKEAQPLPQVLKMNFASTARFLSLFPCPVAKLVLCGA